MKFFKKARDMFDRMTGGSVQVSDAPPPIRPDPTPPAEVIQDPRFKYRREQRDFEARAAETTPVYDLGGTYNRGSNIWKRARAARLRALQGKQGGWKRQAWLTRAA